MTKRPNLRVVNFSPGDYSLGETLALENESILEEPNSIGAVLSLYFQWEKYRTCAVAPSNSLNKVPSTRAEIDFDRDEATPSELRVKLAAVGAFDQFPEFSKATFKIEVFRTCYIFESDILAKAESPSCEDWTFIVAVPQKIFVKKARRLPRVQCKAPKSLQGKYLDGSNKSFTLSVTEMGISSLRGTSIEATEKGRIELRLGVTAIEGEINKIVSGEVVVTLDISSTESFGGYFDYYRQVAYPALRSRYEFPLNMGTELYSKANYFGKYEGEKTAEERKLIEKTWEDIKSGFHKTNADFYIVDQDDVPTGCSGLAIANMHESIPVWAFHQLCALKKPDLIERSGELYTWRAEYLAGRPEDLYASGCFHSKSRWLERIYVKHALNSSKGTQLLPTINKRIKITSVDGPEIPYETISIGSARRTIIDHKKVWAAAGPEYLNANRNLDFVLTLFSDVSEDEIRDICKQIVRNSERHELSILITAKETQALESLAGTSQLSDRFFLIPKADLVNLIASVEHSVAVTEKKLLNGTVA